MTLKSGSRLGSYEIVSLLGSGGMGEVYRAKDLKLGRDVAIKVLREELAANPERLRRFEQEARSASALNHPNIITIYDIGKHEATPYIAMEYVEGKTLRETVAEGPLSTKKLLQLATQIAEGLAKAHSAGIVHRDLKPENLMISSDGYLKILDFGLAKLMPESVDARSEMLTLTKEGTMPGAVVGTVGYMSPEQASGRHADYRSDQFSFGLILYEIATGRSPFRRDTVAETLTAIIREEPEPIAKVNPNLPAPLRWIVERCLAKNPEERYVSTSDLAKELHDLRDHLSEVPSEPTGVPPLRLRILTRKRWLVSTGLLAAVLALLIGLNVGGLRNRLLGTSSPGPIESLAVLPLENISGDPEQEYFAEGMTEELIAELAKIGALRVISRQSVMQFRDTDVPLPEIARALNVDALVEGSVRRSGNRVRITTQLVQASPERHLWVESYERDMQDILALQSEVAQAIAREIRITVTPEEEARLARARPVDPEVYEACLKALFHLNYSRPDVAWEHIQKAINKDPTYALAYARLAFYYGSLTYFAASAPKDVFPKARAAATKALELDPTLAEAHINLAYIHAAYDWDWSSAERQYKQALELNPGLFSAHSSYSLFLSAMGRHEEAIAEAKRAQELDPLSPGSNMWLGAAFWFAGRNEEAIEQLQETIDMHPNHGFTYHYLGWVFCRKGMLEEAAAAFQKAIPLFGEGHSRSKASLARVYALSGRREEALKILDELHELEKRGYVSPWWTAMIYIGLGQKERALQLLEKAYEVRDGDMFLFRYTPLEPLNDDLRDDPRFQDLLRRMNYPE